MLSRHAPAPASASAPKAPLDPTFGIEIECILLDVSSGNERHERAARQYLAQTAVHAALSRATTAQCARCGEKFKYTLPLNEPTHYRLKVTPEHSRWTVSYDQSLRLSPDERIIMGASPIADDAGWLPIPAELAIEINSRVLSWNVDTSEPEPGKHTHRISADDEVRLVYRLLDEDFVNNDSAAYKMLTNPSCSTHVHLGNGKNGFRLPTVKNIVSTVLACERPLDTIHSADRIGGRNAEGKVNPSPYNNPWSAHMMELVLRPADPSRFPCIEFSKNAPLERAAKRFDVPSWLTIIGCTNGVDDLKACQHRDGHHSTVNLDNLEDGNDLQLSGKFLQTIEFRQHAGTLSADKIMAWVEVVVKMVEHADSHTEQQITDLCNGDWAASDHSIHRLLQRIGVSQATREHYASRTNGGDSKKGTAEQQSDSPDPLTRRERVDAVLAHARRVEDQNSSQPSIMRRINEKFWSGCYGQFSREFIDQLRTSRALTPDELAKLEKLTIGWRPEGMTDEES
ncbi:hypothetical protein TI39_contig392g00030 [Zymoseptoria brevis]|uniref:Uncharacterized protein n=1 Tax=Zymoseptoria brevis TaxID=1047168 RepID=A0A0F4GMV7_9PEZI|nr:hypothetical protein TI39_contig392g00030 [Zymoseptoria brevis]